MGVPAFGDITIWGFVILQVLIWGVPIWGNCDFGDSHFGEIAILGIPNLGTKLGLIQKGVVVYLVPS